MIICRGLATSGLVCLAGVGGWGGEEYWFPITY